MKKKYRKKVNLPALRAVLLDSEVLSEKSDPDQKQIGDTLRRLVSKIILKREKEIESAQKKAVEEKFRKTGYYTHADATVPKD